MIQENEKQPKQRKPSNPRPTRSKQLESRTETCPAIRFSPTAWAKLLYFRDRGKTEIGGFGVTSAEDPFLVEDFVTVKQDVSIVSVAFDDEAVADFFDDQVDAGRKPNQFARIWLHTHPGNSAVPSATDEETFLRVFGSCEWAVMFTLAEGGRTFARLRFNVGPGGEMAIPVEVDYSQPFGPSDRKAWEAEFKANIRAIAFESQGRDLFGYWDSDLYGGSCPESWLEELEAMEPDERRLVMDELALRPDLLEGSEVFNVQ